MRRPLCIIQRLGRATGSGGRRGTICAARATKTVAAAMSGLIVLATSMIPATAATVDVAAAPARTQIIMMKDNGEVIETPRRPRIPRLTVHCQAVFGLLGVATRCP